MRFSLVLAVENGIIFSTKLMDDWKSGQSSRYIYEEWSTANYITKIFR
jgi:hypothetical protein